MNEYRNHFGAIRLRLNGSGNLRATLYSYDEVYSKVLVPIVMAQTTNKPQTRLSNFTQPMAKLRIETTAIDETFNISQIIVYTKPVGSQFPQ